MLNEQTLPVPRDFLCPITQEIMKNPVLLIEDGRSYELDAIERWLHDHNSSPMTNKPLNDRRFVNNFNLKNAIEEYCTQHEAILSTNQFLTFNICHGRIPSEWKDKPVLKIRLSLLGGSNAGKTTLARYLQYGAQSNLIDLHVTATIGPDLFIFYLDQLYENKYVIIIQLSDIPGMERYESCCDNHFRHCHGAFLITDSTDIDTLERIELYWYKQLQLKGNDNVESILICNKIDLFEEKCDNDYQRIFIQRVEDFASLHNMSIYNVSALRGDNIQTMFKQFILRILKNDLLLRQIKGNDNTCDKLSIKKERARHSSIIQVSTQSSTERNNSDTYFSEPCCRFA